jgi:hypothetical protein
MAPRQRTKIMVKQPDADDPAAPDAGQRSRPETGRFRLQVDRQTKASFATSDDAEKAGLAIKKQFPVVQVAVYDSEEAVRKLIELSNETTSQSVN